jgi:hypothetical protein
VSPAAMWAGPWERVTTTVQLEQRPAMYGYLWTMLWMQDSCLVNHQIIAGDRTTFPRSIRFTSALQASYDHLKRWWIVKRLSSLALQFERYKQNVSISARKRNLVFLLLLQRQYCKRSEVFGPKMRSETNHNTFFLSWLCSFYWEVT